MNDRFDFETIDDVINDILEDFDEDRGIGSKGYDELGKVFSDVWEIVGDIGKQNTNILDLYMLAFKLVLISCRAVRREETYNDWNEE